MQFKVKTKGTTMRALLGALMLATLAMTAQAAVVIQHYDFSEPQITQEGGFHQVIMQGAWTYAEPGLPSLPMVGARILLPAGEVIESIEILPGVSHLIEGDFNVMPGRAQYPLSFNGPVAAVMPDAKIYNSNEAYPARLHDEAQTGLFRGYSIATFALHPVEYRPLDGELRWLESCDVVITTSHSSDGERASAAKIRHDETTMGRLAGMIDNFELSADYAALQRPETGDRDLDPADGYKYVIITTSSWAGYLDGFVDFQTKRGLKAGVFLKDWIMSNYAGGDEQETVRNFIIDAYETWDVDYVLLVGDSNSATGILDRGLYCVAYGTTDYGIPADLYYGCLDGNWNSDGDGSWGEIGEEDFYHEVGVGRACVSSVSDIQNWIVKQIRYQTEPVVSESDEALMVGELLWSEPTWGGDYKDEVMDGSSTWGYTTVGFPTSMNVDTLYDREGTWSATTLINRMNSGLNIINHLGHCDYGYMMKFYTSSLPQFTNDGINNSYNFIYSQGCNPGGFDNDCIGENFNCDEHGAVALVINSRYGWGQHESTNGSSQYFDRQFFDAMFDEQIYALADANDDSKMDNVWSINYGANRWCYYELNLFGDPAMHLWTATPATVAVDMPAAIFIGLPEMTINVTAGMGSPVADAMVCIYTDDMSVYDAARTNAFGDAVLHPNATNPGTLHVAVIGHDFMPWDGTIEILPPSGPYLVYEANTVLDADGDNDGCLDENETVNMEITLENVGVDPTSDISATLSCMDPYITIITGASDYPDIPAGGMGVNLTPFVLQVAGDIPDEHLVQFTINASSADGNWDGSFMLVAQAPILGAGGMLVNDSIGGDGSGTADVGETFFLGLGLGNVGHSDAENLSGLLTCTMPGVTIVSPSATCGIVAVGGQAEIGYFEVEISTIFPAPTFVPLTLELSAAGGFTATLAYELAVGGWLDDFEADHGWTVGAPDDNASSGIWLRADPVGTDYNGDVVQMEDDHTAAPGVNCFVTGNATVGASAGTNDVDGGKTTLLSPVFHLAEASYATVSYWRWYTNNLGNGPNEDYWSVDVTNDGETWVHLEYTLASATVWTQFTFELTDYITLTDQVQIRFVADDSDNGSLVEAGVDDFLMDAAFPILTAVPGEQQAPGALTLGPNFPNPFNPKTTIQFDLPSKGMVDLAVYDVTGRRIRSLLTGSIDAGHHEVVWSGRDDAGNSVASGLYFTRLNAESKSLTRKIMLLK